MLRLRPLGLEEIPVSVFSPVVFLWFFSAQFSPARCISCCRCKPWIIFKSRQFPVPVHHRRHSHTGVRGSRWGARVRPPPIGLLLGQSWHRWLHFFFRFQDLTVIRTPKNWRGFFSLRFCPKGHPFVESGRSSRQGHAPGELLTFQAILWSRSEHGRHFGVFFFFFRDHLLSDAPCRMGPPSYKWVYKPL